MNKHSIVLSVMSLLLMTSCSTKVSFSEKANGSLYSKGEQTITLTSPSSYPDIKFEKDIATSDITLGASLSGKTITALNYVSADEIKLTISGTATGDTTATSSYAVITVEDHGLTGTSEGNYTVDYVNHSPRMSSGTVSKFTQVKDGSMDVASAYYLPYGAFIPENCTVDAIKTDNGTGTVSEVKASESELYVAVEGYQPSDGSKSASIIIPANFTTFNYEVTILIGETPAYVDMCA